MSFLGAYSFKDMSIIFGTHEIEGFADGDDVMNFVPAADSFTKHVGAQGDVTRSATNDESGTLELKLLQTSKSNAILNAIHIADKASGNGIVPLIATNKKTKETFTLKNAWIKKVPDYTRGKSVNDTIYAIDYDIMIPVIL